MSIEIPIAPTDLRDFAKARGWVLLPEAARDRLYVLTNPRFERRQLVFPMDTNAPDYTEAVGLVVEKLAALERKPLRQIIQSLVDLRDDAVGFRITAPRLDTGHLPLSFAAAMVAGAQQLLLASACTVLRPQTHHPRLSRAEAQQFLEAARFQHTQPGSFVLNVSCPVEAIDVRAPLPPGATDAPFVRRATLTLHRSVQALVSAIEEDSLANFVQEVRQSQTPMISSNFCEALTSFQDETLRNSLDIEITWASSIPRPPDLAPSSAIRVQHDYFRRIDDVRRELRAGERELDAAFIGTVERLDGEMGDDGGRSGDVILSLLLPEGQQVRARTSLTSGQYALADQAHMTDGTYVKVTGRLHPGRQPRQLTDLRAFELIPG